MHYVYVLMSLKDGQFYTGYTSDLRKRLVEHNDGESKSTMHRRPLTLIYFEGCLNKRDA
ncbi:GIY-YIG nuclease family protein, partial [candidate division KSB1 bacterium]|nr:GIY-YIG nuclease family protein [candidate division KSB1 bacterium]NIV70814.1 GIY-YIG nuclease family protein [Phycisphaerae bacterium]NIS25158.1 GIY-YIG nuclease family protein [candidate division KSB1 bacterium]NIT72721.1 GIY-YIG nuclease family protein [candidate division KSB1 bacterium]NIU25659.1 GIY-YIG nuclease family protein [candidate division KSB1 bacterium]